MTEPAAMLDGPRLHVAVVEDRRVIEVTVTGAATWRSIAQRGLFTPTKLRITLGRIADATDTASDPRWHVRTVKVSGHDSRGRQRAETCNRWPDLPANWPQWAINWTEHMLEGTNGAEDR